MKPAPSPRGVYIRPPTEIDIYTMYWRCSTKQQLIINLFASKNRKSKGDEPSTIVGKSVTTGVKSDLSWRNSVWAWKISFYNFVWLWITTFYLTLTFLRDYGFLILTINYVGKNINYKLWTFEILDATGNLTIPKHIHALYWVKGY
jgi:hypothetical protein